MTGPWLSGLRVRRMDRGQTPVADFLCGRCGHHERVTGRVRVADYVRANPATDHRATCPANQQGAQAA
ncbi:transcription factor WhiB [Streptomyces sp. DSM 41524]|uniref:Transcription factor WhiB n=1 Tax=Streptomyces asiaticus subsp. ignotus TaxID=3098222 RepID=A0ABU7QCB0_9ACTN|nr:transcription factor WhiB [Streptomyces sp. DSM 41524]